MSPASKAHAHDAEPDHPALHERLVCRTRELFRLLVMARGLSPRMASDAVAVDLRSIHDMRSVPTLELVRRVGSGLGLEPDLALGVIAGGVEAPADRAALREAAVAADLADDPHRLAEAGARLAVAAENPSDLALAHLVESRAAVARGSSDAARTHARIARELGLAAADRGIAALLAGAARFDLAIGSPWERSATDCADLAWIADACGSEAPAESSPLAAARAEGYRWARALADRSIPPAEARGWLAGALSDQSQVDRDAAPWIASSMALAAITVLVRCEPHREASGVLMQLFVMAQLVLHEAAHEAPHESAPELRSCIEARLSRMAFAEWSLRASRDGVTPESIDAADAEEIVRACMRLDGAHGTRAARGTPRSDFSRTWKSLLDASSGDSWMVELVQFPHATGACLGGRSEDPCRRTNLVVSRLHARHSRASG